MEQIQFIYFQDYMQYYTVHQKENSTYMEIWQRGWWFKLRPQLPVCFGFSYYNKNNLNNTHFWKFSSRKFRVWW